METVWFTADTHFGHAKIIDHMKRPFPSVTEMDEALIENWNKVIKPNHTVWHLGDFSFRSALSAGHYLSRLNGLINIIWGNHDEETQKEWKEFVKARRTAGLQPKGRPMFESAQEVKFLRVNGEKIYLSHYAHRTWQDSHKGAWHLFGHSHGMLTRFHRSMDVGVDCQGFHPVHFDVIREYMINQPVTLHHPELLTDSWEKEESEDQSSVRDAEE